MQLYHWRARSKTGKLYQGDYMADSKQEVALFLRTNYDYITGIEEVISLADRVRIHWRSNKIEDKQLARIFQQLSTMLASGIPLSRTLELLKTRCSVEFAFVCNDMIAELQAGKALAEAMRRQEKVFSAMTVAVVEAGEQGGLLQEMLAELAVYYNQRSEMKRFLKNICLYPCFVLLLTMAVFTLFIVKLLPMFAALYQDFSVEPIWILQVMLSGRELIGEYWQIFIFVISAALYVLYQQRLRVIECFWHWPGIAVYRQMFLEIRFCKILSLLLHSGIALPLAIESASESLADQNMVNKCNLFADAIVRGSDISKAAALAAPLLSAITIEFLLVGESSGTLDKMIQESAKILEQDFMAKLKDLKVLFEPILLVLIALIVGVMIFSVAGPLLTLLTEMPEYE